jgi:His/Glu/Gln/Arg/opine family amino acid ABC transporter permease subunit
MTLHWGVLWQYRLQFLSGLEMTVLLTVLTMALAVPFGLLLAFLRLSRWSVVRAPVTAFVEIFRATPLLLQVYWAFYVLPALTGIGFPAFTTALFGLVCNVASFNSETFRAGIISIRAGQRNAAFALGMRPRQVMRHVVLPQALRRVLPALATTWVSLFKDTSLVSTIAVGDLSYQALQIRSETYRVMEVLTAMAAIYWLLGYPQAKLADWLHHRLATGE